MTTYEPTEFHADHWEEEPYDLEAEEQRLSDLFSAYVQRYQGDRDLSWLQDQAFDESFGSSGWDSDHQLIRMFVEFTRCVVVVDEEEDSPQDCMRRIVNFCSEYNEVSSTNPIIQGILRDMRFQLRNRRDDCIRRASELRTQNRSRSSSNSSDSSVSSVQTPPPAQRQGTREEN